MAVAVKEQSGPPSDTGSKHSQRLEELRTEAAEIRRLHDQGMLTPDEAASRLHALKQRYRSFLDRFL